MRKERRRSTLKKTYYRSFLLLVVIPLVLVFIGAEFVVGYMIRGAAVETINALQDTVATTLSGDVRTNALQLSHFVYINDGEFPQTAVQVHHSSGDAWYEADQMLQRAFRTAMVPSHAILAGGFYMADGGAVYMKDDIALPEEAVRASGWYQDALARPNTVTLGCYDTSRVRLSCGYPRRRSAGGGRREADAGDGREAVCLLRRPLHPPAAGAGRPCGGAAPACAHGGDGVRGHAGGGRHRQLAHRCGGGVLGQRGDRSGVLFPPVAVTFVPDPFVGY